MKQSCLMFLATLLASVLATPWATAEDAASGPAAAGHWVTSIVSLGEGDQIAFATAQGLLLREGEVHIAPAKHPNYSRVAYTQPSAVWAVAASADGQWLASSDYRGNLAIHQVSSGETTHHDQALERWTRALAFSPDDKFLVGGNEAGKIIVWNRETAKVEKTHELEPQAIMDVRFSPEGDRLAVADGAGHVHLLAWPTLEAQSHVEVSEDPLWSVAFTADGILAGAADNTLYRLQPEGETAAAVDQLKDWVAAVAVSRSQVVAAGELNGRVQMFTADGQTLGPAADSPSGVWTLHWTADNTLLVGTRKDGIQMMRQSWDWVEATPPPAKQEPAEEQAAEEKPEKEMTAEEKPAEEKPAEEKPAEEKPAEEKPAEEKPAEEKPAEEKPAEEKPAEEKPAEEKPAEEKPAEEKTAEE